MWQFLPTKLEYSLIEPAAQPAAFQYILLHDADHDASSVRCPWSAGNQKHVTAGTRQDDACFLSTFSHDHNMCCNHLTTVETFLIGAKSECCSERRFRGWLVAPQRGMEAHFHLRARRVVAWACSGSRCWSGVPEYQRRRNRGQWIMTAEGNYIFVVGFGRVMLRFQILDDVVRGNARSLVSSSPVARRGVDVTQFTVPSRVAVFHNCISS